MIEGEAGATRLTGYRVPIRMIAIARYRPYGVAIFLALLRSPLCLGAFANGEPQKKAVDESSTRRTVTQVSVDRRPVRLPITDGMDMRFSRPSAANALLHTSGYLISQDDQGFLWLATRYGLYRYDGYNFKVFAHERGNPNSLSGVEINSVFRDRDGAFWIGCAQFLNRLDPATESFKRYRIPSVIQISQDIDGTLWLSTPSAGLYGLDPVTGQIRHYSSDPHDLSSLSSNREVYTGEDREGRMWVASIGSLDEFDRKTGKVTRHIPMLDAPYGFKFYEDRFGVFWIFHISPDPLTSFDRKTNTLRRYAFPDRPPAMAVTRVTAMLEDRNGSLWIGTHGAGLLRFDREHRRFIRYRNHADDANSLPENDVDALFEDREGGIWVGLGKMGVVRAAMITLPFKKLPHPPGIDEPFVGAIYEDRQRVLWVGTPKSLNRIDRKTGSVTPYKNGGPDTDMDVISLCEDHAGNLWVGTYGHGLLRFDRRSGKFKIFKHNPADPHSLSDDFVRRLLVDHNGTLWAGTQDGLDRFDSMSEGFTTYNLGPRDKKLYYLELVEDRQGALWLGTEFSGLQRFDPVTGQFKTYQHDIDDPATLSDDRVNSLLFDRTATMWVGTQNGLDKFDAKTGTFLVYSKRDGLPGNAVGCVLDDRRGNLWMSTDNGIARFDTKTLHIDSYSTADGLPGPNLTGWGACFKNPGGEMFFGGFSGATAFLPSQVLDNSYRPPIVLTDFRLSGNPVGIGGHSPLQKPISYTRELTLPQEQNIFSLTFAALSYANPDTNRYRYRLESLEHDWNEVGNDRRQVGYTTLPPGEYTFRAQGATSHGPWSEPGVALRIRILPPWWGTWWFRAVAFAVAGGLLWTLHLIGLRQIAREFNVRLDERVGERTRIARDLHDTLLQSFHGLMFRFQAVRNMLPRRSEEAIEALDGALDQMEQAIAEGRDAIQGLRSSTVITNELAQAVTALGKEMSPEQDSAHGSARFHVVVEGAPRDLHPILRDEVYAIAREAVRNAFRHSQASNIEADITYNESSFQLRIRDDGKGMDPGIVREGRTGHYGMPGLRERAKRIGGKLDVWTAIGAGTEIELSIPGSIAYGTSPGRTVLGLFRKKEVKS